jgi:hypothetical protein
VRVNDKEGLAKSDKASNVQNRIWRELMQLHAVHKEEPTKKLMGRKRKSTKEKGKEHHMVAFLRLRDDFSVGEDGLRGRREKTLFLGLHQIYFCDIRCGLAKGLLLG